MKVRRRLLVSGRVQGVFYRDTCRRVAAQHGVGGHATNRLDGRVEVVLEGEREAVDQVVAWCSRGPRGAEVTDVQVSEEDPEGLTEFRID